MPFISNILDFRSLSIVGLEKNTGKTVCLNYILNRLPIDKLKVAITSIGIDGEGLDQVTSTAKPEITVRSGMYFSTSEKHYRTRRLVSELVNVSDESTSLGRVVTAKALIEGKVLLSGPASGLSLKRWMRELETLDIDLVIIDGALSRLSSASPAISQSMILATGAAYSNNIKTLVQKTAFVVDLINIEEADSTLVEAFDDIESGVWYLTREGVLVDTKMATSLADNILNDSEVDDCRAIFVAGALTDRFLNSIRLNKRLAGVELLVRDFTKLFIQPQTYNQFLKAGGCLKVLHKSKLLAITVNPTAPSGLTLDSNVLCDELSHRIGLPVYDLLKCS